MGSLDTTVWWGARGIQCAPCLVFCDVGVVALVLAVGVAAAVLTLSPVPSVAEGSDQIPGARPAGDPVGRFAAAADGTGDGLQMAVNERGRISSSVDGVGTVSDLAMVRVAKPEGATVRSAYLAYATTGSGATR